MNIGDKGQSYEIIAIANGYVMGKSPTAPSPYGVWKLVSDSEVVWAGHYFVDQEEAEWDFCARAFDWFEDNMYIHMTEDGKSEESDFDPVLPVLMIDCALTDGLKDIRAAIAKAAQLVDEMSAELDKLKARKSK